ncbi:MAG TPA: hypothetical protein VJ044_18245, partial [Candidatus Hodarchaeales archaeon]|nr:hypothetical protein [Candidatus Hodarchaeales archaeon]
TSILFDVLSKSDKGKKWAAKCLSDIVTEKQSSVDLDDTQIREHWQLLDSILGPEIMQNLVNDLSIKSRLIDLITGGEFDTSESRLYTYLSTKIETEDDKKLASWIQNGLEQVDENEWKTFLVAEADIVGLVLSFMGKNDFELNLKFSDGLVAHIQEAVATGKYPNSFSVDQWRRLPSAVGGDHKRRDFRRKLLHFVESYSNENQGNVPSEVFDLFGSELSDKGILIESDRSLNQLLIPLVSMPNPAGLRWIEGLFRNAGDYLADYGSDEKTKEDISIFKERIKIQAEKQDLPDELISSLTEIARMLKIKIQPPQSTGDLVDNSDGSG